MTRTITLRVAPVLAAVLLAALLLAGCGGAPEQPAAGAEASPAEASNPAPAADEATPEPAPAPEPAPEAGTPPAPAPDPTPEPAGDTTHPFVVSIVPGDGARDVLLNAVFTLTFSEPMAEASAEAAFQLTPSVGGTFAWNAEGTVLTYVPTTLLPDSSEFDLTVVQIATDRAGLPLASQFGVFFVTEDGIPPRVDGTVPEHTENPVAVNLPVRIQFTEPVDAVSAAAAVLFAPAINGTITFDATGTELTFTPETDFQAFTTYTVTVGTEVRDPGGTPMAAPFSFYFTTDDHRL